MSAVYMSDGRLLSHARNYVNDRQSLRESITSLGSTMKCIEATLGLNYLVSRNETPYCFPAVELSLHARSSPNLPRGPADRQTYGMAC